MDWFLPKVRGNCSKWIVKGSYLIKQNEGFGAIMTIRICPCRNSSMDFFPNGSRSTGWGEKLECKIKYSCLFDDWKMFQK